MPLQYTSQDRAVTSKDYETIVKTVYPNAQSVSVGVVKMMKHHNMVLLKLQSNLFQVLH